MKRLLKKLESSDKELCNYTKISIDRKVTEFQIRRDKMLKGKTAIVTGAAKGIGKAIAIAFAKEGCNIVLNYHSNVSDETIKEIEDCGVKCMPVQGDVSDFDFARVCFIDV